MLKTPHLYAIAAALAFTLTGTEPPRWLANTTDLIGGLTIPLLLITLGVSLARMKVVEVRRPLAVALARVAMGLAVALGLCALLDLEGVARGVVAIACCMPGPSSTIWRRCATGGHRRRWRAISCSRRWRCCCCCPAWCRSPGGSPPELAGEARAGLCCAAPPPSRHGPLRIRAAQAAPHPRDRLPRLRARGRAVGPGSEPPRRQDHAVASRDRGEIEAGEPIHGMWLRLVVDSDFVVRDVEARMEQAPYAICQAIEPAHRKLIGATIGPGWSRRVHELLGGTGGCTHLREMLGRMATVAFQAFHGRRRRGRKEGETAPRKPWVIRWLPRLGGRRAGGEDGISAMVSRSMTAALSPSRGRARIGIVTPFPTPIWRPTWRCCGPGASPATSCAPPATTSTRCPMATRCVALPRPFWTPSSRP